MVCYTFRIEGMHCTSCGLLIDDAVEQLPGVRTASTSQRSGRTTVEIDDGKLCTPSQVVAAIAEAGYTATLDDS